MNSLPWITTGALVVALLFLTGCNVQYRMLYYPSPSIPSEQSIAGTGIRFWPSYGEDYRGFIGGNETDHVKGTFIVFHGNGGTAYSVPRRPRFRRDADRCSDLMATGIPVGSRPLFRTNPTGCL